MGGTAWGGVGMLAAVGLALGVNALGARLLADDDFGAFLLMVSLAQAFGVLVEAGQPGLIVREVAGPLAGNARAASRYVIRALTIVTALGLLATAFTAVAGAPIARLVFGDPAIVAVAGLLGLLVLARAGERTVGDAFRGQHDIPRAIMLGTVWSQLAGAVALGALLVWGGTTSGPVAVAAYGLAGATVLPLGIALLRPRLEPVGLPLHGHGEHLREGWPLVGHRALAMVVQQAPLWIVASTAGAGGAAPFGLALRVVSMVAVPLTVVNQVVPPVVARLLHSGDDVRLERAVRATATLAAAGAVVVVAVFAAFGEPIVAIAFGQQYAAEAGPILAVLSLGQLGAVWSGSCGIVLLQLGRQRTLRTITATTMVVELVLAVVAAVVFGPLAVAVVAAVAVAAQNVATVVVVNRVSGLRTDASLAVGYRELRLRMQHMPRRRDRHHS